MDDVSRVVVYLASPAVGCVAALRAYAALCVADALRRGEHPIPPNALYVPSDVDALSAEDEMDLVIRPEVIARCDVFVAYADMGWTAGMVQERDNALLVGMAVEERYLSRATLA